MSIEKSTIELKEKLENLLKDIREFVGNGNYIFRGEPEEYPDVSSNLYRQYEKAAKMEHFIIERVQDDILENARKHVKVYNRNELLEQLQHYGGKTNQIDFTTDYLVALFFACEGEHGKDGRLIFLNRDKLEEEMLYEPQHPQNRVIAQKSIFVRPPSGVINPDKVISIESKLKLHILDYLNKHHSINVGSMYNDIHGFIDRNKNYQNAYTHFFLGLAYQQERDNEKALGHYTKAIDIESNHPIFYNNRGILHGEMRKFEEAFSDFKKAIELRPAYAEAYSNRSIIHSSKNKFEDAITDCNKSIELKPDYPNAYDHRGSAYFHQGELALAIADYEKCIELDPNYFNAYNNRGQIYYNQREYDKAFDDVNKAIELKPDYAEAYNNRGLIYARRRRHGDAISDYDKAIELMPSYLQAHFNRGLSKVMLTNINEGKKDMEIALQLAQQQGEESFAAMIQEAIDDGFSDDSD